MSAEIKTLHLPFRKWLEGEGILYSYNRSDQPTTIVGDADFLIHRNGRCLMVEFKDKETPVSKGQKERHAALALAGCRVFVMRRLSDAIELVRAWLDATAGDAVPILRSAEIKLRQSMGFVFEQRNGRWESIRRATNSDSALPAL